MLFKENGAGPKGRHYKHSFKKGGRQQLRDNYEDLTALAKESPLQSTILGGVSDTGEEVSLGGARVIRKISKINGQSFREILYHLKGAGYRGRS